MFGLFSFLALTALTLFLHVPPKTLPQSPSFLPEMSSSVSVDDQRSEPAENVSSQSVEEPLPVSREQYEAALSQPPAVYTGRTPHTTYQSLELHWEDYDEFFSAIRLGLSLPQIPGLDRLTEPGSFDRHAYLTVSRVMTADGVNVYDASHAFEESPFDGVQLRPMEELPGYVEGERQIHVQEGSLAQDIVRIDGRVILELPVNVRPFGFTPWDVGQMQQFGSTKLLLKETDGLQYSFDFLGKGTNLVRWIGYDALGKAITPSSYTADIPDAEEQPYAVEVSFDRPVATVRAYLAEDTLLKTLPFTLEIKR